MNKNKMIISFLALTLLMVAGFAGTAMAKKAKLNKYMVVTTHTEAECKATMGEISEDKKLMANCFAGCNYGDHTVWTMLEAENADACKAMLPESMRTGCKIVQVDKCDAKMMKKMHKDMKM